MLQCKLIVCVGLSCCEQSLNYVFAFAGGRGSVLRAGKDDIERLQLLESVILPGLIKSVAKYHESVLKIAAVQEKMKVITALNPLSSARIDRIAKVLQDLGQCAHDLDKSVVKFVEDPLRRLNRIFPRINEEVKKHQRNTTALENARKSRALTHTRLMWNVIQLSVGSKTTSTNTTSIFSPFC